MGRVLRGKRSRKEGIEVRVQRKWKKEGKKQEERG